MRTDSVNEQAAAGAEVVTYHGRWLALAVLLCAVFMNMLDVTIVNVALPSIQRGLNASNSAIEWIVAGYVLVFALALLPFGRLGDIVGKKTMFLIGVSCFTLASAHCGFSDTTSMLVTGRLAQGFSAAMMTPQVLALAQVMFAPHERARAFSYFGMMAGVATVSGPIIGGFLVDHSVFGLGWRAIFLINVPIGIFAVIAGMKLVPSTPRNGGQRNDVGGILLIAIAMFMLIFPLVEGRTFGWPLWCFAMMLAAVPVLVAFVLWERRRYRHGHSQLLSYHLMQSRNFALGGVIALFFFSTIPGFFLCLAIFLQVGFGFDPLKSGLTTVPFSVGVFAASILSGRLGSHYLRLRVIGGVTLLGVGMLWLRFYIASVGDVVVPLDLSLPLVIAGFGLGVSIASIFQLVLSGVPHRDAGAASGAMQAIQQLGGAFGIAFISGIFFARLAHLLQSGAGDHAAYADAFAMAMIYSIVAYVVVIVLVLLLPAQSSDGGAKIKNTPHVA